MRIAQLRCDAGTQMWSLWWADRNDRWDRFRDLEATSEVDELLEEIDEDPTGIFWG